VGNSPDAWELLEGHPSKLKLRKFALPTQDGFRAHFKRGRELGLEKHLEIIEVVDVTSNKKEFHLFLKDLAGLLEYFDRTFKQVDSVPEVNAAALPAIPSPLPVLSAPASPGAALSPPAHLAPVPAILFSLATSEQMGALLPVVDECHLFNGNGNGLPTNVLSRGYKLFILILNIQNDLVLNVENIYLEILLE